MPAEKQIIRDIVTVAFEHASAALPLDGRVDAPASTLLTGDGGVLTSLGVISLVLAVEENVNEAFSTEIVLFDESLLADPDGPFRTIGTFVDHVCSVVQTTSRSPRR